MGGEGMPTKAVKKRVVVDDASSLSQVLTSLRSSGATTRPEVSRVTGLGRTLVTKHVEIALRLGLLEEGEFGASTGGRAPRSLQFNKDSGYLLVAELGATGMRIAKSDLSGQLEEIGQIAIDIALGPEKVLSVIEETFDKLKVAEKTKLWGIGIGLPGPVEFAKGLPMSPPIMPNWDKYPVRERFASKYSVPVWVDNDANLMALGDITIHPDEKHNEMIYIKIGSGIGAGIIANGTLHRGAQGCAGDIGHIAISDATEIICRCGKVGCLEAIAGGTALARDAELVAESGKSKFLSDRQKKVKKLTARDVIEGAQHGDAWSVDAINKAGQQVGKVLATLINFYNPSLVVIGGGVSSAGNLLLAAIRETVYRRSLPLATRDLEIRLSEINDQAGLRGAAEMVLSELFTPFVLGQWIENGRPRLPIVY